MKAERFKKDWPVEMVYTGNTFLPEYKWLAYEVYFSAFEVKSFVPVNESRLYFNLYLFLNKTNQTRPPNNDVKNENRFIMGGSSFSKPHPHWRDSIELNRWMNIFRSVDNIYHMEWVNTLLLDDWLETPYKFMELVGDEFIYHVKDEQMKWLLERDVVDLVALGLTVEEIKERAYSALYHFPALTEKGEPIFSKDEFKEL